MHTLLPRQTGGLSQYFEVCEPRCWEKKLFFLFGLFCPPLSPKITSFSVMKSQRRDIQNNTIVTLHYITSINLEVKASLVKEFLFRLSEMFIPICDDL